MAESDWKALIPQADALEYRCANEWDASTERRRQYRAMRRVDPVAAHNFMMEPIDRQSMPTASEIDQLFDSICGFFFGADETEQAEVTTFFRQRKRLLGNLRNYVARCARRLQETGDDVFLFRGLSAVVVDGGQSLLDFTSGLRDLHAAGEEHGLNPDAYFRYAESLSNSETRQLLSQFVSRDDIGEEVTTDGEGEIGRTEQGREADALHVRTTGGRMKRCKNCLGAMKATDDLCGRCGERAEPRPDRARLFSVVVDAVIKEVTQNPVSATDEQAILATEIICAINQSPLYAEWLKEATKLPAHTAISNAICIGWALREEVNSNWWDALPKASNRTYTEALRQLTQQIALGNGGEKDK